MSMGEESISAPLWARMSVETRTTLVSEFREYCHGLPECSGLAPQQLFGGLSDPELAGRDYHNLPGSLTQFLDDAWGEGEPWLSVDHYDVFRHSHSVDYGKGAGVRFI